MTRPPRETISLVMEEDELVEQDERSLCIFWRGENPPGFCSFPVCLLLVLWLHTTDMPQTHWSPDRPGKQSVFTADEHVEEDEPSLDILGEIYQILGFLCLSNILVFHQYHWYFTDVPTVVVSVFRADYDSLWSLKIFLAGQCWWLLTVLSDVQCCKVLDSQ